MIRDEWDLADLTNQAEKEDKTMRISTSDKYYHGFDCELEDCERHYCRIHRLLWRDCDTAIKSQDAEYADGHPHHIYVVGYCPLCERGE